MASKTSGEGKQKHSGGGFPLWALALIIVGIVLLLNNFGWLPWGVWGTLWRFWPVLIILVGVNIIWGRSHPWVVSALTLLTVLIVLGIGIFMSANQGGTLQTESSVTEPKGDITRAEVQIDFNAGNLMVDSLAASSMNLVEADGIHTGWNREGGILKTIDRRSGVGILTLAQEKAQWFFSGGDRNDRWKVHLAQNLPIELTLKTGASDSTADLSNLKVTKLDVQTGASQLDLTMPASAGRTTNATIQAGAADVKITFPQNVAARISTKTGLSSTSIDEQRFPKTGNYYESPNYETAANRVDLEIEGGVANIRIK